MTADGSNGWPEYKVFITEKLEEHSSKLQDIYGKVSKIGEDVAVLKVKIGLSHGVWGAVGGLLAIIVYLFVAILSKHPSIP